jgi:TRAP-type C4-dicarboxylate transport system substrate-binding protein
MRQAVFIPLVALLGTACATGAVAAPEKPHTLRLNEVAAAGSPEALALQSFASQVDRQTHHAVRIDPHLSGGLGNAQTSVENMMFGDLDIYAGNLVDYLPLMIDEVNGLTVPFLLSGRAGVDQYIASPLLNEARDKVLTSRRIIFLEMTALREPYHILVSGKPIRDASDLKGLNFASVQPVSKIAARVWAAAGAHYLPEEASKMQAALKSGDIDAALFPDLRSAMASGALKSARYVAGIDDCPQIWQISINQTAWNGLSAEQQKIVSQAAQNSGHLFEQQDAERFRKDVGRLRAQGITYQFIPLPGVRDAVHSAYDSLESEGALNPRVVQTADSAMRGH